MNATYSFARASDALQYGFVIAESKRYQTYRGCYINGYDTSGRGMKGYSYGLRAEIAEDYTSNHMGVQSDKIFGKAVWVNLGIQQSGPRKLSSASDRKILMFEPHVFKDAIEQARIWIDMWFAAHPQAIERAKVASTA